MQNIVERLEVYEVDVSVVRRVAARASWSDWSTVRTGETSLKPSDVRQIDYAVTVEITKQRTLTCEAAKITGCSDTGCIPRTVATCRVLGTYALATRNIVAPRCASGETTITASRADRWVRTEIAAEILGNTNTIEIPAEKAAKRCIRTYDVATSRVTATRSGVRLAAAPLSRTTSAASVGAKRFRQRHAIRTPIPAATARIGIADRIAAIGVVATAPGVRRAAISD